MCAKMSDISYHDQRNLNAQERKEVEEILEQIGEKDFSEVIDKCQLPICPGF